MAPEARVYKRGLKHGNALRRHQDELILKSCNPNCRLLTQKMCAALLGNQRDQRRPVTDKQLTADFLKKTVLSDNLRVLIRGQRTLMSSAQYASHVAFTGFRGLKPLDGVMLWRDKGGAYYVCEGLQRVCSILAVASGRVPSIGIDEDTFAALASGEDPKKRVYLIDWDADKATDYTDYGYAKFGHAFRKSGKKRRRANDEEGTPSEAPGAPQSVQDLLSMWDSAYGEHTDKIAYDAKSERKGAREDEDEDDEDEDEDVLFSLPSLYLEFVNTDLGTARVFDESLGWTFEDVMEHVKRSDLTKRPHSVADFLTSSAVCAASFLRLRTRAHEVFKVFNVAPLDSRLRGAGNNWATLALLNGALLALGCDAPRFETLQSQDGNAEFREYLAGLLEAEAPPEAQALRFFSGPAEEVFARVIDGFETHVGVDETRIIDCNMTFDYLSCVVALAVEACMPGEPTAEQWAAIDDVYRFCALGKKKRRQIYASVFDAPEKQYDEAFGKGPDSEKTKRAVTHLAFQHERAKDFLEVASELEED